MNSRSPLANMPPVVKNLILVNVLFFLVTVVLQQTGTDLNRILGLYFPASDKFRLHQVFTHMFMHGSFLHLAFNMFMLWMFGRILESNHVWGSKKFLIYYLVTGLGAATIHTLVNFIDYYSVVSKIPIDQLAYFKDLAAQGKYIPGTLSEKLTTILNTPTIGASGAVYGVLLAFGMLFPNTDLYIYFIPIPVKAKYVVIGMIVLELIQQFGYPGSHIAHMAHLGGMLFGYFMIKYWNKKSKRFY